MRDPQGFLTIERHEPEKEPVVDRVRHSREFERSLPQAEARAQAQRCMGCGVPFCHTGCPLGNVIPDFNELVHGDRWREAFAALESTNNFPEITGRVCPAPCESACVLAIHDDAVAIKSIERAIADRASSEGWLAPRTRAVPTTGKKVAIVGSGPAGLACAEQLASAGHDVTVFEREDRVGGLLRYGIPDFKLEKRLVDARVSRMRAEGVVFETGVHVGVTVTLAALRQRFDAVALATGATVPRELDVPGRSLRGVHLAMDYLVQANRRVAGDALAHRSEPIVASGKRVVILGGGDTGSDCLGTAIREGASSVVQIELMPRPPDSVSSATPWPSWPLVYRTSSSQEEGGEREFAVRTQRFLAAEDGAVRALELVRLNAFGAGNGPGARDESVAPFLLEADLVLLALGFTGPDGLTWANDGSFTMGRDFSTNQPGVFACGDARRGASLVVWAIWEGREAARAIDVFLMKQSRLRTSPYAFAP